jgi:hypothetical protein
MYRDIRVRDRFAGVMQDIRHGVRRLLKGTLSQPGRNDAAGQRKVHMRPRRGTRSPPRVAKIPASPPCTNSLPTNVGRAMAMGKRRRHATQTPMWVATQDLPRSAAHPFYRRLNQILDKHDFDGYVEGLCTDSTPTRSAVPVSRH